MWQSMSFSIVLKHICSVFMACKKIPDAVPNLSLVFALIVVLELKIVVWEK